MSTFGGVMVEFPDVRVDFFRPVPGLRPPLACFLSHVHSDHLAGLESLKSPFIYCSAATKELLLRLERYPHRLNFELGILEARKQTYKHLQKLLKSIPLETPTRIELQPGKDIQVTLFDANHCTGAVMFLFEADGKAALYTGDIRSEPWFVSSLTRNPFLIEYTSGLKTLDCIYLDTSNTGPVAFPTKADGIKELLQKVSEYPPDTIFHFASWTFGYEEVWMALSKALKSPIHVDRYKLRLYQSLRGESSNKDQSSAAFLAHESPALTGYTCGNTPQDGCLTDDQTVRLHSCEKGMRCSAISEKTVWIKPIIARTRYGEIAEVGVGGGGGDLAQRPELELDNASVIDRFLSLFADMEDFVMADFKSMLMAGLRSTSRAVSLDDMGLDRQEDELSLSQLIKVISRSLTQKRSANVTRGNQQEQDLPRTITFPYSRHSSFAELCELVRVFRPKDVYACTVDANTWHEGVSIQNLFGKHCSASLFRHDVEMRMIVAERSSGIESQQTHTTEASAHSSPNTSPVLNKGKGIVSFAARVTPAVTVRLNSQSLPRPLDASGIEVPITSGTARKVTPPLHVSGVSPGSESQGLRRKAILDDLGERDVKRARLQFDDPGSSPLDDSGEHDRTPQNTIIHKTGLSAHDHIPNSDADSNRGDREGVNSSEHASNSVTLEDERAEIFDADDSPAEVDERYTFFDYDDQVLRCKFCGYEVWGFDGFCTGVDKGCCREGLDGDPYFEVSDPEAPGSRPRIATTEYSDEIIHSPARRIVVGNYLDDDSSAYDSQDGADRHFNEEYEEDGFIDDDPHAEPDDSDEFSSSDGETDWKEQYNQLRATHDLLLSDYGNLADDFGNFKRDVLGSDFDSGSEMEERDEDDLLIVDVSVPDPVVTELVLSQAQEQSQNSEITDGRLRDRVEAFDAALSVDGWHNITMVSTQDNHTNLEIEL